MATPTTYNFTQEVDDTGLLTNSINTSALSTSLSSITTVGSGSSMLVAINFADVLSSPDQATLTTLMNNYSNIASATITHMISSISTSVQTSSNLITLLTAKVTQTLPTLSYEQLSAIMTLLNLS